MNTRLRFKLIALLITLSLAGLVAFQGYWLYGLYNTLYGQMEVNIHEAMKIADYKEMFLRMKGENEKQNTKKIKTIYFSSDENTVSYNETNKIHHTDKQPNVNLKIDYTQDEDSLSVDSTLTDYLTTIKQLENIVQQAFHANIDQSEPIVFREYNKFLQEELKAKNIDSEHLLIVAYQPNDKEKIKSWMNLNNDSLKKTHYQYPIDTTVVVSESADFNQWKNAAYFDYPIQSDNTIYYRLYLKSPARVILNQMSGILASSILLFALIVISFVYLLRTILKQKTIEELKTDFTNNMTHELKTPISVSYAAVDAMLNFSDAVNDKQRKYLTIMRDQLTRLTGLVEQILTLAVENRSTFRLHPEQINISGIVASLTEQYKLKADKKVRFVTEIPDKLEVYADHTHIYNMLSNLIENAIKYCDKEPCLITLKANQSPDGVRLSVTDNGIGISETNQKRVFDKFFRVPSGNLHNVKGYGLGLYYVKDMMIKHKGFVSVESHPDKGSTFTLHFINQK
ncbi:sensor histidine kinase [Parabacteroides provencensis]|uniref:sensor histidine kinase n=1 Tax=Parabacteroides provencensis TaxID=1944636 RepID=UPI000C14A3CE|nr:HAMP domain-containing sensor histidine kinase [Parabacteroides provencensis]